VSAAVAGPAKRFMVGTHRVRPPQETWDLMAPRLSRYGITRVADVTGLDRLSVPVMMAVRPLAKTVSVSQGKGTTALLATVSAVMEGVEMWHAEYAHPPVVHTSMPADALDIGYEVRDLAGTWSGLFTGAVPADWVAAEGLVTGRRTVLPAPVVCMTEPARQRWHPAAFGWTSNGLASGNNRDEAVLHGLYEVIERDGLSQLPETGPAAYLDLTTVDDPSCAELIGRIRRAGAILQVAILPTRPGIPCFLAWLWTEEFAVTAFGSGAHLAPEVALSRAITEAAQSRLTAIVGSRDDLAPIYGAVSGSRDDRPTDPPNLLSWPSLAAGLGLTFTDIAEERHWLAARVRHTVGAEPVVADLSTEDDFAVVRVVVPGAELDLRRVDPTERSKLPGREGLHR
jgi:ribosomal protein S12 methylthiotransferase accessory factor